MMMMRMFALMMMMRIDCLAHLMGGGLDIEIGNDDDDNLL